jgi:hypothetical protein
MFVEKITKIAKKAVVPINGFRISQLFDYVIVMQGSLASWVNASTGSA